VTADIPLRVQPAQHALNQTDFEDTVMFRIDMRLRSFAAGALPATFVTLPALADDSGSPEPGSGYGRKTERALHHGHVRSMDTMLI
jgi:hypothetical protein